VPTSDNLDFPEYFVDRSVWHGNHSPIFGEIRQISLVKFANAFSPLSIWAMQRAGTASREGSGDSAPSP